MATNILMPALSPTMTEGTLSRWLKKEGDAIKAGDVIAEIETDKATMEVEAVDEGVLGRILVGDGTEGVKVNEPIAVLVDKGEAVPAAAAPAKAAAAPEPAVAQPAKAPPSVAPPVVASPVGAPPVGAAPAANGERIFASPLARRMALQAGIDLGTVRGTGPNGRIVRADIEAVGKTPPAPVPVAAPPSAARAPAPAIAAPHRLVPHSSMRKVIARRLTEAKSTIPHFYVSMDIELDAMIAIQEQLNAKSPARDQPGSFFITINDVVIKAAAATLRRVPEVNASWTDDGMVFYDDVDISVAVSIPDGLITPIVRKADQKGLLTISREMRDLATRARGGKLKPEEFQGGGFSISNMGMFGVSEFSAIINPPQSAILAVATGSKRPVVKNGALAIATVMTCTLSVDHRCVDGALGARWLREFKTILEDPLSLMLWSAPRFATRADLADIVRLVRGLAEYERMLMWFTVTEDYFDTILFGPDPIAEVLLAEVPGQGPVGIALYTRTVNTFRGRIGLFLEDLFVEEAHRGKGLGLALLRRLAEIAVERNHNVIEWRVLNWNEPSIRFYESLGATQVTDWQTRQLQGLALDALARGERFHG